MNWKPNTETPPETQRCLLAQYHADTPRPIYETRVYSFGAWRTLSGEVTHTPDFWAEFEGPRDQMK